MKYIDVEKLKEEIEKRRKFHDDAVIKFCNNRTIALTHSAGLKEDEELIELIDSLRQEQPSLPDNLDEAAEEYIKKGKYLPEAFVVRPAFIAGAEWQKEQDQPITGNSLEQEWLRYVDKKKKEYRGELPALGEYGWLQIARHFAEWQKEQMLKDAVEGVVCATITGTNAISFLSPLPKELTAGDKVRIVILKQKEE